MRRLACACLTVAATAATAAQPAVEQSPAPRSQVSVSRTPPESSRLGAPRHGGAEPEGLHADVPPAKLALEVEDLGDGTLLFHRAAPDGGGSEGFVIDTQRLRETLALRVLAERGLGALVQMRPPTSPRAPRDVLEPGPGRGFELTHDFAEPFGSLSVRLSISALEEPDAGETIYLLAGLVLACTLLGLVALYRMAATQIAFAQRQRDFVAAVSHELKTPLTAIRMHAEMLRDGLVPGPDKQAEYHRTITRESERLSRLIGNVLELSRLERQAAPRLASGNASDLLADAVQVLRPHAEQSGHELCFEVAGELPCVRHDPDALRQVVFNLIDNALKYARDAEDRRILVRCEAIDGGLALRVSDRGPGVDARHLPCLFEPFYRGERELTREHSGTGIGLALVQGLVHRMGGRVSARNLAPGFEVCVWLPRG